MVLLQSTSTLLQGILAALLLAGLLLRHKGRIALWYLSTLGWDERGSLRSGLESHGIEDEPYYP